MKITLFNGTAVDFGGTKFPMLFCLEINRGEQTTTITTRELDTLGISVGEDAPLNVNWGHDGKENAGAMVLSRCISIRQCGRCDGCGETEFVFRGRHT